MMKGPKRQNQLQHNRWIALLAGALTTLAVFGFQNCGKGFSANKSSNSVAQCQAQAKAEVQMSKFSAAEWRCSDFNSYACEERVFSPDVEDMTHSLKECVEGTDICVDVEVRQFNTASAKAGASPEQFQPGGDYNRQEIRCYHRSLLRSYVVFEGEGDSLASALAKAMAACEAGVTK